MTMRIALSIVCVLSFLSTLSAAPSSSSDSGFVALLTNRTGHALALFAKDTTSKDKAVKARALRGMGLVNEALGNDVRATRLFLESYQVDGDADHLLVNLNTMLGVIRQTDSSLYKPLFDVLGRLRRDNPSHPAFAELSEEMGAYVMAQGNADSARAWYEATAPVRNWKMVGPFDNVSNSGILRAQPVEKGFNFQERYTGLAGQSVSWNDFQVAAFNGWALLSQRQGVPNALDYFATTIKSPRDQDVQISFGVSGVFSLWIDGQRVAHSEVFQNTGREGYRFRTRLRAGETPILLKLGHEDAAWSNFILRVADTNGVPLRLESIPMPQKAVGGDSGLAKLMEPTLVARFRALASAPRQDPEALLQLARHHLFREEFLDAKRVLRELANRYPSSALVAALTGEVYSREDNATLSEVQYEKAFKLDTAIASGWMAAYAKLVGRESWSEAYDLFQRRPRAMILANEQIVNHVVACYKLSRQQEMFSWIDSLLVRDNGYAQLAAAELIGNLGNQAKALQIAESLEKKAIANQDMALRLAVRLRTAGRTDAAESILKQTMAYYPDGVGLYANLADLYYQNKDYAQAMVAADAGLKINPWQVSLLTLYGRSFEMQGKKKEALDYYGRALRIGRNDFELSDRVFNLSGRKTLRDLVTPWDLFQVAKEGRGWSEGRKENSLVLLNQRSVLVHNWGAFEMQDRLLVEVLDPQGVDDWKEHGISYESNDERMRVLRAVSIKPDGKTLQADRDGAQLVFAGLAPGDLIEIIVSRQISMQGQLAGHFWTRQGFALTVPVLHSQLEVLSPDGVKYSVKQHGIQLKPVSGKRDGLIVQDFQSSKMLSSPPESSMPPWDDALSWVQISSVPSWSVISNWYDGLTEGKSVATPELRAFADSLFAGAADDNEKIRRVHDFITGDVRYSYMSFRQSGFVPQAAAKTLATRIGDCKDMATLAKALLALGGVSSDLVLVNTNEDGRAEVLPMIEFNHCILRTARGEYIDYTASHNGWKSLPRSDQGARAIIAAANLGDSLRWLPWLPSNLENTTRNSYDTLFADGSFARRILTTRQGNFAAMARGWYRFQSEERNRLDILRSVQKWYPGAELTLNQLRGLDSLDGPVVHEYAFRSRLTGWVGASTLSMPVPWADDIEAATLPGESRRHYTYEYWRNWKFFGSYEHRMNLVLPTGWKLLELPRSTRSLGDFGTYESSFAIDNGVLVATRRFTAKIQDVPPSKYAAFRSELEKVLLADRSMLVLVKE